MTIEVPDSRPDLLAPSGDVRGLDEVAQTLFATAARYDDFADSARAARPDGTWSGRAYDAYVEATGRAAREHDALAVTVRRVARACAAGADTLGDLRADFARLAADKSACDRRRAELRAEIEAGGAAPADPGRVSGLQRRARALAHDYAGLVADHHALQRRVEDHELLLLRAFVGATTLAQARSGAGGLDPLARAAMALAGAPGPGATAAGVRAWWGRLSEAQRAAVVADCPRDIGSAAGVPAVARDRANRVVLDDVLAELGRHERDGTLTDLARDELATARATRQALRDADAYLDPVTGRPAGGLLWAFDPAAYDGQGSVTIAVGDPDTAADVSVRVPGATNRGATIALLTDEAIRTHASARANGDGSSVASLAWMGYDAPDGLGDPAAYHLGRAAAGGDALAVDLEGLRAARSGEPAHLTVIGHSYGSTTVGQALVHHHLDVDDVVLVGSPGVGADRAADLGLGPGHVWVGADSDDVITHADDLAAQLGGDGLGVDPASAAFGAVRFEAESPGRNGVLDGDSHVHYFDDDSESAFNLGHVVDGTTAEVRVAEARHPGTEQLLVDGGGHLVTVEVVVDPEATRPVTAGEPGRSSTVGAPQAAR